MCSSGHFWWQHEPPMRALKATCILGLLSLQCTTCYALALCSKCVSRLRCYAIDRAGQTDCWCLCTRMSTRCAQSWPDIAQLCAALLEAPSATDTTFEVKTTQPFPEPFVADESTPARDWQVCAARPPPPPPPPPSLPQTARAHAYRDAFCRCRALF